MLMVTFEPRIVGFLCNWCSYAGADQAGANHLNIPPSFTPIRVMCSSRLDPVLILTAFLRGADGVLVAGCHPGDCHYTAGNYHARRRWTLFRDLLETMGIDLERIHFAWISAAEGKKFAEFITEITDKARQLGPYRAYREICE